jgi:hypothetical protein
MTQLGNSVEEPKCLGAAPPTTSPPKRKNRKKRWIDWKKPRPRVSSDYTCMRETHSTPHYHTHTTQKEKEKYLKREEKKRVLESISFTPVRESPTRYYPTAPI